jgi:polyisoprenoid-binding protein YceI
MTDPTTQSPVRVTRALLFASAVGALAACSPPASKTASPAAPPAAAPAKPAPPSIPAGAYKLDPAHASLEFKVNHLGFSHYTARFTDFDATLQLDPANPAAAQLQVTVDPRSLELPRPPAGFKVELLGKNWLDAGAFPQITFRSTQVATTGPDTARITGDLTLHGVTKPVTLETKFNGGYAGHPMDPHARAGFSAHGVFKRSDFGIGFGVPAPGSTMGVSDEVEVLIETEFSGPPFKAPPQPAPAA